MSDVAEAFFETAMEKGVYRKMNPKMSLRYFWECLQSRVSVKIRLWSRMPLRANAGNG
jgi:hypothetical protein